jgi:hypothetical protein
LWRCGDGLFFEVPPSASDALLTTLHPLAEYVLQTVDHFEISCLGAPFLRLEKPRNLMGARSELNSVFDLEKVDRWNPIRTSAIQSRSHPMRFLGFSNHEKGAPRQRNFEMINGLQHVFEKWVERFKKCIACQGRYFEKETVTAPPQVPTRDNEVSPRTFQTALVKLKILYALFKQRARNEWIY